MEDKEIYIAQKMLSDYSEKQTTKVDELKNLDKKAKTPANVVAYILGTIFALILGTGMCLALGVIGGTTTWLIVGIVVGIVGIILCASNYSIYKAILSSRKKKYSEEIIFLSNDILSK